MKSQPLGVKKLVFSRQGVEEKENRPKKPDEAKP
jgi:hypothetical protein